MSLAAELSICNSLQTSKLQTLNIDRNGESGRIFNLKIIVCNVCNLINRPKYVIFVT